MAAKPRDRSSISMIVIVSLFLVPLFWGCVMEQRRPSSRTSPQNQIGRMEAVEGSTVTVAGRPARVNMPVYAGEEVKTGSGSTATVRFGGGGLLVLNENTDPILDFAYIGQSWCIFITMFYGHAQLDSAGQCISAATPESEAFIGSRIDIRIEGGRTTWRLVEGRLEVATKLKPLERKPVRPGELIVVSRTTVYSPMNIPEPELRHLKTSFFQMRAFPAPTRPIGPALAPRP